MLIRLLLPEGPVPRLINLSASGKNNKPIPRTANIISVPIGLLSFSGSISNNTFSLLLNASAFLAGPVEGALVVVVCGATGFGSSTTPAVVATTGTAVTGCTCASLVGTTGCTVLFVSFVLV